MDFKIFEKPDLWEILHSAEKPIVLYGMGNGGDKILNVCEKFSIKISAVFASDGFVRGQIFRGYTVKTLSQIEAELGQCIVLLAFATARPGVLADIEKIAHRHILYAPDVPAIGDTLFTRQYAQSRADDAAAVYDLLADDLSRKVYLNTLEYKLSGNIDCLHGCAAPREELWRKLIKPGKNEIFVDAGAYRGDTVEEFIQMCGGEYERMIAIEPDKKSFAKLEAYTSGVRNISLLNIGVWNQSDILPFAHKAGRQASLVGSGVPTAVDSIDNILAGEPASIIKYDVEGAERKALEGTHETIKKYAPKLIVSAYHRSEDLFDLPLALRRLNPKYKIYLRKHPGIPAWDINAVTIKT